ncbi:MAG: Rdx family protein [Planctomycetia bacterium]|nr:Rdx family protein [Planctomycetia bacterium]
MTDKLLTGFKQKIKNFTLVPAGGGCFEVTVNDELIYSKLQTGVFPDEQAIIEAVGKRLKKK